MDATSKKQHHFYSIQVATYKENLSAGIVETVHGDTNSQVDVTKISSKSWHHFLKQRKQRFHGIQNAIQHKKNGRDRGPTSRSWVEQLEQLGEKKS